jgi:thiol-disulfide isomerase/thioredoxin
MNDNRKEQTRAVRVVLGLTLILPLIGCSVPEAAVYADRGAETADSVLAVVGGVDITESEVADLMASQLMRVDQERYDLLKQGVEQVVADRLMELEAKKRGISVEELTSQEVEAKVTEPTEADVDAFYEERKDRIRQPKEEATGQIRDYLLRERQAGAHAALVAELKSEYGFEFRMQPIRVVVASEGFPVKGPENAPITIVEFSDFECPYCARVNPALEQIFKKYGGQVRLVFRQFPLDMHANAQKAAEASLCGSRLSRPSLCSPTPMWRACIRTCPCAPLSTWRTT